MPKKRDNTCRAALEHMVWRFAYRAVKDGKPVLWTRLNSTLRDAFHALGWDDPKIVEDADGIICDAKGCPGWVEIQGGMWPGTGYWCLCREHQFAASKGEPQPEMKQRALDREVTRGEDGCLPK